MPILVLIRTEKFSFYPTNMLVCRNARSFLCHKNCVGKMERREGIGRGSSEMSGLESKARTVLFLLFCVISLSDSFSLSLFIHYGTIHNYATASFCTLYSKGNCGEKEADICRSERTKGGVYETVKGLHCPSEIAQEQKVG